MFQFRRFPTYTYFIQCTFLEYCSRGFPHSEICGSKAVCASPQLIAACHVLHRLLMPRHSPCALISLTFVESVLPDSYVNHELCRHSQRVFLWLIVFTLTRTTFAILYNLFHNLLLPFVACSVSSYFQSTLFSFQGADLWSPVETRYEHSIP